MRFKPINYKPVVEHFLKSDLFTWRDMDSLTKQRVVNPLLDKKITVWAVAANAQEDSSQRELYFVRASDLTELSPETRKKDDLLGFITPRQSFGAWEDTLLISMTEEIKKKSKSSLLSKSRKVALVDFLDNTIGNSWTNTQKHLQSKISKAKQSYLKSKKREDLSDLEFIDLFVSGVEVFIDLLREGILDMEESKVVRTIAPRFFAGMQ